MATKTINIVQKVQGTNDSVSAQMVTVRDGYSSVPTHYKDCGLGGTGEKQSKPNNAVYIRFGTDFTGIPAGAIISSAVLTWSVIGCDWKCAMYNIRVSPCGNFTNALTGANRPPMYAIATATSTVSIENCSYQSGYLENYRGRPNGRKVRVQNLTWDLTNTVRYLVANRLNCVKVYVSPGKNRKYLAANATLNISYISAPDYCNIAVNNTDCNVNTHFEDTVTVTGSAPASAQTTYFRFYFTSGSNTYNTAWSANPTFTFSEIQNMGTASLNNLSVTCKASYDSAGQTTVSSSTLVINKNLAPVISPISVSSAQNTLVVKNSVTYARGLISINANVTDASVKLGYNNGAPNKTFSYSIYGTNWGSITVLPENTMNLDYSIFGGKLVRVYCNSSDGFKSGSNYLDMYACTPVYIYSSRLFSASQTINGDRIPANTQVTYEAIVRQDQGLNNLIKITRYKKTGVNGEFVQDNVVTRAITINDLSYDSFYCTITDTLTTPSSETTYYEYKWVVETTDLVKGTATISATYKINRIPSSDNAITAKGVNYPDHIVASQNSYGQTIYSYSEVGALSNNYVDYRDNVGLSWALSSDADGDIINYAVKKNGVTIKNTAQNTATDTDSLTQNAALTYTLFPTDSYNSVGCKTSAVINTNGVVAMPSGVILEQFDYDTQTYTNVVYTQGAINRIGSKVKLTWNAQSNNVTPSSVMRYHIQVCKVNGEELSSQKSIYTGLGDTSCEFTLDVPYTATTQVALLLYAVDRFNLESAAPFITNNFYLQPEVSCPQIMGTKNGGYLWDANIWSISTTPTDTRLKKPLFFAVIRNPDQSSALNVVCKLYPRYINQTDVKNVMNSLTGFAKTPYGLEAYFASVSQTYNVATLAASSNTVPENSNSGYMPYMEKTIAFRLDSSSYLTLNTQYYVILRLQKGSSTEYFYTSMDESSLFTYADHYSEFYARDIVGAETKIYKRHTDTIQSYISKLYESYGFASPVHAELETKMYASTDNLSVSRPLEGLNDQTVAEPLNYNICPYPYQVNGYSAYWYDISENVSISDKKLVFNGEGWANSLYLPWNYAETTQIWLSMDILLASAIDLSDRKYIKYQIEFFDANKNVIPELTINTAVLLVDEEESLTSTNKFTLLDTYEVQTGHLQNNVAYTRLKIMTDDITSQHFLGQFEVENIMVYKGTDDTGYVVRPYLEYSDDYISQTLSFGCGSFNSWIDRLNDILYDLINTKLYNVLIAAGVSQETIGTDWLDLGNKKVITPVDSVSEITAEVFKGMVFKEDGLWDYLTRI